MYPKYFLWAGAPSDGSFCSFKSELFLSTFLAYALSKAYGWRADLSDDEILARLVALNEGCHLARKYSPRGVDAIAELASIRDTRVRGSSRGQVG
jgi:hypothetical protein